jgi:hypothetical protein
LLANFQFKQIFLFELPKINESGYKEAATHLDEARKKLAMRDYPEVLVQCQKALERAKEMAKSKGFLGENGIDF